MPRPRITIRLLMLAVLLVAAALAIFETRRRWDRELPKSVLDLREPVPAPAPPAAAR